MREGNNCGRQGHRRNEGGEGGDCVWAQNTEGLLRVGGKPLEDFQQQCDMI